ncbi:MAG: hypothetical protein GEV03_22165 [Streptosporangiales bacterium]|nr:hypothetical protein [Streptosporangiales bacterium]
MDDLTLSGPAAWMALAFAAAGAVRVIAAVWAWLDERYEITRTSRWRWRPRRRWYAPGRVVLAGGAERVVARVDFGDWTEPGGPWVLTYPSDEHGPYAGVWYHLDAITPPLPSPTDFRR